MPLRWMRRATSATGPGAGARPHGRRHAAGRRRRGSGRRAGSATGPGCRTRAPSGLSRSMSSSYSSPATAIKAATAWDGPRRRRRGYPTAVGRRRPPDRGRGMGCRAADLRRLDPRAGHRPRAPGWSSGHWPRSPFGPVSDVMVQRPDGHRVLLAPSAEVAEFVGSTYTFDEVRLVPVTVGRPDGTTWTVDAGPLRLRVTTGPRPALGRLLRAVPARLARTPGLGRAARPAGPADHRPAHDGLGRQRADRVVRRAGPALPRRGAGQLGRRAARPAGAGAAAGHLRLRLGATRSVGGAGDHHRAGAVSVVARAGRGNWPADAVPRRSHARDDVPRPVQAAGRGEGQAPDRAPERRDREGAAGRDLRLGPAPLPRA